jgi:hypothetical protein
MRATIVNVVPAPPAILRGAKLVHKSHLFVNIDAKMI